MGFSVPDQELVTTIYSSRSVWAADPSPNTHHQPHKSRERSRPPARTRGIQRAARLRTETRLTEAQERCIAQTQCLQPGLLALISSDSSQSRLWRLDHDTKSCRCCCSRVLVPALSTAHKSLQGCAASRARCSGLSSQEKHWPNAGSSPLLKNWSFGRQLQPGPGK